MKPKGTRTRTTTEFTRATKIYPTSTVAFKFVRLNLVHYSMWGLLQEKVFKICVTYMDELKERLRMEWAKLDHVVIVAAIRQWSRR